MKTTDYEPGRVERTDESDRGGSVSNGRNGPSWALIAFVAVAGLATWFFLTNSQTAEIDYLVDQTETTVRWALLIALALGIVLDRLVSAWWRRARRNRR